MKTKVNNFDFMIKNWLAMKQRIHGYAFCHKSIAVVDFLGGHFVITLSFLYIITGAVLGGFLRFLETSYRLGLVSESTLPYTSKHSRWKT